MLLALGCSASSSRGALQLSALSNPTLQTLMDMGSAPVAVGPYLFDDFSFVDASSGTSRTAAQIQVQAFTTNGYGLQFVANWFAADGSMVNDVIAYDVQASSPAQPIGQISLLSNGTAPVPVSGTFTTATLISSLPSGATAAPVLSTYNDGFTTPVDTTKPDVNYSLQSLYPQTALHIIDTLFAISTASNSNNTGGVATASVLQNAFVPSSIPEPSQPGWVLLPMIGLVSSMGRQWRRTVRARAPQ